jgi:hypothetical protein
MRRPPSLTIWWLPTLGFFLFASIEFGMFSNPSHIFEDPGVGRHLRTAELILETGVIPRTDGLSWTKAGAPWTDFEWAFEATLGELYRLGGLGLIAAFCYAIYAATVLGVYRTLVQSGVSFGATAVVTLVTGLTLLVHFSARPVLFTYLSFALVVEVWNRQPAPRLRDWIILPVVFVAWANLHGGWMGALVFLGLALVGRVADRVTGRADGHAAPVVPWLALTGVLALVTSLNPWGWGLWRSVYLLATSLKSASLWVEYLPPNFGTPSLADIRMTAIAVLFIVGVVFTARLAKRAPLWRWEILLPVLFFLYEGLKAQRHVLLLIELAAVPVARDFEALLPRIWAPMGDAFTNFEAKQRQAGADAWLALLVALLFAVLMVRAPIANKIEVGNVVTPELVAFLRDHPDRFQRPLTTTANAGPLLWAMRPDFRVSIDDRGDFYGDAFVYHFVDTTNASEGWDKKLQEGDYDSLLLDPYLPINRLVKYEPEWKLVWHDDHVNVYWRDRP